MCLGCTSHCLGGLTFGIFSSSMNQSPPVTSPRDRGFLLQNLAHFQTELARLVAGFIPGLRAWRARVEMPRHVFGDFRIVQDLRTRQRELGVALGAVHLSQAVPLRELFLLLGDAPSAESGCRAVYGRVKPRLAAFLEKVGEQEIGIYDLPSQPLIEANRDLLARQQAWASEVLGHGDGSDAAFDDRIDQALMGMESSLLQSERPRAEPVKGPRRWGCLPLLDAVLPDGFAARTFRPERDSGDTSYSALEHHFAANFLQEVQASDSCASLLFDAPDLPWEFYFDCARHMWDESRHSVFGEKKLEALGITKESVGLATTAYRLRQTLLPHDRYAALTTQEAEAFPNKHKGLRAALENNDSLGAMTWSYDIADETQHVRYGQKWLPVMIAASGDPRSLDQVREDATHWRKVVLTVAYRATAAGAADSVN